MTLTGRDEPPTGTGEDVLVLHRWEHGEALIARIRTGSGADFGAVAGEAAILAVVASWLRGDGRRETSKSPR